MDSVAINQQNYDSLYASGKAFLRWPADWLLRFNNMFLRSRLVRPARILDFGCGSANNSIPFLKEGHEVHGVDVATHSLDLISRNLEFHNLNKDFLDRVTIGNAPLLELPYEDDYFDFIISNQVHYYSTSEEEMHLVNTGLHRVLRPGGFIFVTMMGPRNYYITDWVRNVPENGVYQVRISDPAHRLYGVKEDVLLCHSEEHLKDMFSEFTSVTVGYFDQKMFDMYSNFHWIFVGTKERQ